MSCTSTTRDSLFFFKFLLLRCFALLSVCTQFWRGKKSCPTQQQQNVCMRRKPSTVLPFCHIATASAHPSIYESITCLSIDRASGSLRFAVLYYYLQHSVYFATTERLSDSGTGNNADIERAKRNSGHTNFKGVSVRAHECIKCKRNIFCTRIANTHQQRDSLVRRESRRTYDNIEE